MVVWGLVPIGKQKSTVQIPFFIIIDTRTGSKLYWFSIGVVFCSFKSFSTVTFSSLSFFGFDRLLLS